MPSPSYERKHYYQGDKARDYEASRIGRLSSPLSRHRWNEELRAVGNIASRLPANSIVLDAPCGTGRFLPLFTQCGHRAIGGDISRDMLSAMPDERFADGRAKRIRCDVERLPFAERSIDVVLAMRFWSFLTDDARQTVFAEWRRVGRGLVFLQVRFRVDDASDMPSRAVTTSTTGFSHHEAEDIDDQQRQMWPRMRDFTQMVADCGFEIARMIPLDWGPTDDSVFIAELRPMSR